MIWYFIAVTIQCMPEDKVNVLSTGGIKIHKSINDLQITSVNEADQTSDWNLITIYTTSWGCWKHVFGIPGVRPMFLKAELHKESKNGFKTINSSPPLVMIFSKNRFGSKKLSKKLDVLLTFEFLWPIYMNNLDQFWKIWKI